MRIILLGAPGSGKDTQSKTLSKHFGLKHISSGEIFRSEYERKTELGLKAYEYWGRGNLAPDELTISLIHSAIPEDNYILNGYPRTIAQAEELENFRKTTLVLYLMCDKNESIKRLRKRAGIEKRIDDKLYAIIERINVYKKQTEPLLDFYKARKKLFEVDGNKDPKEVSADLIRILESVRE